MKWNDCYKDVAKKFSEVKKAGRKFYADKNELEILQALQKYSIEDLIELLDTHP